MGAIAAPMQCTCASDATAQRVQKNVRCVIQAPKYSKLVVAWAVCRGASVLTRLSHGEGGLDNGRRHKPYAIFFQERHFFQFLLFFFAIFYYDRVNIAVGCPLAFKFVFFAFF